MGHLQVAMGHLQDEMRQFYTLINNKNYLLQPYLQYTKIATGIRTANQVSDVVTIAQPNFANRLSVFVHTVGTVTNGAIRLECAVIPTATTWQLIGSGNTTLNASDRLFLITNDVGPYHYVRARIVTTLTGTGTVDVYILFSR